MRDRFVLAAALVLTGACSDLTSAGRMEPGASGPGFARSLRALQNLGPGWSTPAGGPHACFASVENPGRGIPYLYSRFALNLEPGMRARGGEVTAFRFVSQAPDGRIRAVINCIIPATARARAAVARRLRIPLPDSGSDMTTMGCVIDNSFGNPCVLDPVVVVAVDEEEPPCDYAPVCNPDHSGSPSSGTGGTGGCANCGPDVPRVQCPSVQRGQRVRCLVSPAGDLDVISWTFTDGTSTVTGPSGNTEWSGPVVASGDVTVRMRDGTVLVGTMSVQDRGWTWATHAVSEYSDGTGVQCLNYTPTFNSIEGLNLPLGATSCTSTRRQIQPDSYDGGDGFVAATVPGGPNRGMHYVSSASLSLRRESTYNSGVFPAAPRVPLIQTPLYPHQTLCGRTTANWYEFNTCMHADADGFIAGLRAHEGRGSHGNNGHYSAAYNAVADPANDPMILFDRIVATNTISLNAFIGEVRREFYPMAESADRATRDIADGGSIVTGNWSGQTWRWLSTDGRFVLSGLHSF
jgi:hypothetical protein